jgi:hypothetical protein
MKPKHILGMLLALVLFAALIDARVPHRGAVPAWALAHSLIFSFLCFSWYRLDSEHRQYRRTFLLNIGVIALAPVAIPCYVVRSRPAGQKGRGLLRLGGFVLLLIAASVCGALI